MRRFFLLLVTMCLWAAGAFANVPMGPEFQALTMPMRPGQRSVERLLLLPDGLYGVTVSEQGRIGYFRVVDGEIIEPVAALPNGVVEPLELADRGCGFTWDPTAKVAYSLSSTGKLLKHTGRGADRKTEELGQVSGTRPFEDKQNAKVEGYQRSSVMFFDPQGNLYTAGKDGFLFRYAPATGKLEQLDARLPAVRGREPWASLDAAVLAPDGMVYGGTFDGYLFSLDLQTLQVVNLGKPLRQGRIPGLVMRNGNLYGIGGDEEGLPRTFLYDIEDHGFVLGTPIQTPAVPGSGPYSQHEISPPALVIGPQNQIYLATTGRLGGVFRWIPHLQSIHPG
ncbi:MAG: NHL repeat-containing protein [Armatimonadota bacterium]